MSEMKIYPCPLFGFLIFDKLPASNVICPICGCEDDPVQLKYPALRIGSNKGMNL